MPTVGIPQTAIASRRPRRNMSQGDFWRSQSQPQLQQQQPVEEQQPVQQGPSPNNQQQQFEQQPITGDYIQEQLTRLNNRSAPPMLEPGARVKSASSELVQPSSFQSFYQQMQAVGQAGQEQIGAAAARSAFQRMLQQQQSQQTASMGGSGGSTGRSSSSSNKSGGGNAYGNAIPSNPQANFRFAQNTAPQFGWDAKELQAWYTLGMKESGWRHTAQNPTSTAYGIGQFLNSTWKGVGMAKTSDPQQQVLAMAKYIKNRYGSPSRALAFHLSHNWY